MALIGSYSVINPSLNHTQTQNYLSPLHMPITKKLNISNRCLFHLRETINYIKNTSKMNGH